MPALGAEVPAVQLPMLRFAQDIGWKPIARHKDAISFEFPQPVAIS